MTPAAEKIANIELSSIIEGNPIATIVIDANHQVTHWNRACEQLTGVPHHEIVGTSDQWRAFYPSRRPIMADLIVSGALEGVVDQFYHGKFTRSQLIEGAFEAEDFFPHFGQEGRWLFFTAAPIRSASGEVVGAIETLQDVSARRQAEEELRNSEERFRRLSITDSLTGLFNSRHLHVELQAEIERSNRYQRPLSLLILDADHFKRVNDTWGHQVGDSVLQTLAGVINECLRRTDSAYRYGGEEFVVVMPETSEQTAASVAERLRRRFADRALQVGPEQTAHCTVSIGVAQYREGEEEAMLIQRADQATYAAKEAGRNRVVLASVLTTASQKTP